jgi:hypothetical protein
MGAVAIDWFCDLACIGFPAAAGGMMQADRGACTNRFRNMSNKIDKIPALCRVIFNQTGI